MKLKSIKYWAAGVAAAVFAAAACEKDKDFGNPVEEAIAISSITIPATSNHSDASTICLLKNEELQLSCTISPAEGITFPEVKWSTSNEAVVTVSESGKLTAVGIGTAIVRVAPAIGFGPTAATPSVTVRVLAKYVYMSSVSIVNAPATADSIAVGESIRLAATHTVAEGDSATFIRYKWTSDNTAVAKVDEATGVVTGTGSGTAVITATADDKGPGTRPSASATIGVKQIVPIETLEIVEDQELMTLGYGQKKQIRFNVTPANATVSAIQWESDNAAAISVSSTGLLTVNVMDGAAAVITVTAGEIVKTVNVAVAQGRLAYSFANTFAPWTITTAGAVVESSDSVKTTIAMSNPTNEGSTKHRGDINLVTNNSGAIMTVNASTYRYLAVKMRLPTVLVNGSNSNGCIKLEMFDNPRTIGPVYTGEGSNQNNRYTILNGDAITPESPNVLYFDLQGAWSGVNPTVWTNPFNLVQFKFVIADYPVAADWRYDTVFADVYTSGEKVL